MRRNLIFGAIAVEIGPLSDAQQREFVCTSSANAVKKLAAQGLSSVSTAY